MGSAGWALLIALALLGVALSALVAVSNSPLGRPIVAGLVVRQIDRLFAGRIELGAVVLLPQGGVELQGLRVFDPHDHLVLQVSRARFFPDATRLFREDFGIVVELDAPSVLLETEPDGTLSLARAFAPADPAPTAERPPGKPTDRPGWTFRLTRLTVRGGNLWWHRDDAPSAAEVTHLELDAEGAYGHAGGFLGLRLRADAVAPVAGPLALDALARLDGDRLDVPVLRGSLGPSVLELLGVGNLKTGAFRAAVTRLGVGAGDARRIVPKAALGGDLAGAAYAESDGKLATAALDVRPAGPGTAEGTARVAVAARTPSGEPAVGFDVVLAALDPSKLLAQAPAGRITLAARGAAGGHGLADGRGRLALELAPSRLRDGELGPVSLEARAGGGLIEVARLDARLPGLGVAGSGRWRDAGAVGGDLTIDSADLARLGRNLAALTGVPLPPLGGRFGARATLGGTAAAPAFAVTLDGPLLAVGTTRFEAAKLTAEAMGPLAAARGQVKGSVARVLVGGAEARRLELTAALAGDDANLSITGSVPALGAELVGLKGTARLAADRRTADLRELSIGWPGSRFALVRSATATFAPPGVDRVELANGPRRLVLSGGLGPAGALDLRLEAVRLDLAQLPSGLLPAGAGLQGELSFDARATGTTRSPDLAIHLSLSNGEVRGLAGLQLLGDLGWDGSARRFTADLGVLRAAGGALEIAADLPLPLAGAAVPLAVTVDASDWPVDALRQLTGAAAPVKGTLGASLEVTGSVAAPELKGALTLDDLALAGFEKLGAALAFEGAGDRMRITASTRHSGAPLVNVDLQLPIDLNALLLRPGGTVRGLRQAPLAGMLEVPGLELAALAGRAGLPEGLAGKMTGSAALGGTLAGPRGKGTFALAGGAVAGYREIGARIDLLAEPGRTAIALRTSLGDAEALQLDAALGAAVERLTDPATLRSAPLSIEAKIVELPLARASGPALPLSGTLAGHLEVRGSLARPEGRLDLGGKAVEVGGRPLGDLAAVVRYEAAAGTAELSLRPAAGGVLWAGGTLAAQLGLDVELERLLKAPATLKVTSEKLDLGFLPAMAPGLVRAASGLLTVELADEAPLARLRPRGKVKLANGRLAISEVGDWTEIEVDAALGDKSIELSRLGARRGAGKVFGRLSVREIGSPVATVDGRLEFKKFAVARAGMELATLDFPLELKGTLTDALLDTTLTLPGGTIRLPKKTPRTLQTTEKRVDIAVGRPRTKGDGWFGPRDATPAGGSAPKRPFEVRCRLLVPGKFFIKGERPAIDLELKGDSTWRLVGTDLRGDGSVTIVRGTVEPMVGRIFKLDRGRVTFADVAVGDGQLDVVARYDNPAAEVTVTIGGTVRKPTIALSSNPAMDDTSIAVLIATGRTDLNLNTSEIGAVAAQEAGMAVASAAVGMAFQGLVAGKLPVDQVSVDASTVRAGKYLTDKIFVGYTYRFDAKPEDGENTNEVRAEYKITPRWDFELRYGDAQSGGASLLWSKDY